MEITGTTAVLSIECELSTTPSELAKRRFTTHHWTLHEGSGAHYAFRTFTIDLKNDLQMIKHTVSEAASELQTDCST